MLLTRIVINGHFKVIVEVEGHILPVGGFVVARCYRAQRRSSWVDLQGD
jgi:hypothetical protein